MSNPDNKKSLSLFSLVALGMAIFTMHFGASSMLWPTTWGRNSGTSFPLAFFGLFVSGALLPWLGYIAASKRGGSLFGLIRPMGKVFCLLFGAITVALLGPCFAVPR